MLQPRIAVLEDPSYEKHSLTSLKRIAFAYDVALVVRFVSFSELLGWATDLTPEKLAPPSFKDDMPEGARHRTPAQPLIFISLQEAASGPGWDVPINIRSANRDIVQQAYQGVS